MDFANRCKEMKGRLNFGHTDLTMSFTSSVYALFERHLVLTMVHQSAAEKCEPFDTFL